MQKVFKEKVPTYEVHSNMHAVWKRLPIKSPLSCRYFKNSFFPHNLSLNMQRNCSKNVSCLYHVALFPEVHCSVQFLTLTMYDQLAYSYTNLICGLLRGSGAELKVCHWSSGGCKQWLQRWRRICQRTLFLLKWAQCFNSNTQTFMTCLRVNFQLKQIGYGNTSK